MLAGIGFDRERLEAASGDEMLAATEVADLLVRRGVPFREAHGIVGGLVRSAVEAGVPLRDVQSEHLDADARALLEQASWLESKASEGGTASARVREQLDLARAALAAPPA
jgi:argininosuccinate lyase